MIYTKPHLFLRTMCAVGIYNPQLVKNFNCGYVYEAVILVNDPEKIKILKTEFESVKTDRFEILTEKEVKIRAKDAVALKSALMSVSKALEVYEKMQGI